MCARAPPGPRRQPRRALWEAPRDASYGDSGCKAQVPNPETATPTAADEWLWDSGADAHVTGDASLFITGSLKASTAEIHGVNADAPARNVREGRIAILGAGNARRTQENGMSTHVSHSRSIHLSLLPFPFLLSLLHITIRGTLVVMRIFVVDVPPICGP